METLSTLTPFGRIRNLFNLGPTDWMGASSKWSYDESRSIVTVGCRLQVKIKHLQKIKDALVERKKKFRHYISHVWSPADEDFVTKIR